MYAHPIVRPVKQCSVRCINLNCRPHQEIVDRGGGPFPRAHGADYRGRAGDHVTSRPDTVLDRFAGLLVGYHCAVPGDLQPFGGGRYERVGRGAEGDYNHVDIDGEFAALFSYRAAPAAGIGLSQLHLVALHGPDPSLVIADYLLGIGEELEYDAFLLGVLNFFMARRQLGT